MLALRHSILYGYFGGGSFMWPAGVECENRLASLWELCERVVYRSVRNRFEQNPILFTRLETRIKEFNSFASIGVSQTLMQNESNHTLTVMTSRSGRVQFTSISVSSPRILSKYVGTRKIAIYTWAGWSQMKIWWRTERMLTCKSLCRLVYRGERLIELSSSWLYPKFLSG